MLIALLERVTIRAIILEMHPRVDILLSDEYLKSFHYSHSEYGETFLKKTERAASLSTDPEGDESSEAKIELELPQGLNYILRYTREYSFV